MKIIKFIISAVILLTFISKISAQDTGSENAKLQTKYDTWSLKLHVGTMQFYGDISYNTFFPGSRKGNELSLTGHVSLHKQFSRYFGLNGQFLVGNLASEEEGQNEYFNSQLFNYNLNGTISLSNLLNPSKFDKKSDFYFIVGLGRTHYRTLRKSLDDDTYIGAFGYKNDGTEKDKMLKESCANIGTGWKYRISPSLDLELEVAIKSTPRDRMDGLVNVLTELDKYGYSTVGISYTIGKNKNVMQWDQKENTKLLEDKVAENDNSLDSLMNIINNLNNNVLVLMNWHDAEKGPDADNDSVPDYRDVQINTPGGVLVDVQGREVPNCCDPNAPNYKGGKAVPGSSTTSAEGPAVAKTILFSVYFGLNSTYVTPLNHERIGIAANYLIKNPDLKYELVGSACSFNTNPFNIDLSKRRVETIKNILIKEYGIDAGRLVVKYVGEEKPLNVTEENKFINRRVDIIGTK